LLLLLVVAAMVEVVVLLLSSPPSYRRDGFFLSVRLCRAAHVWRKRSTRPAWAATDTNPQSQRGL
jgi:hypothetical protein